MLKGAVHWYCFDAKLFNVTACFITKCDAYAMIMHSKWLAMDSSVQYVRALVTFLLAWNISIDWQEELYMW